MLDTNICIYIIKRKPIEVFNRLNRIKITQVCISSITMSELWYGVAKSSNPEQNQLALTQFIAPIDILTYDEEASYHYGLIRTHLEKNGTPIGSLDMLIAAHARSIDCTVVTNNMKEFNRVPGLKIDNWV